MRCRFFDVNRKVFFCCWVFHKSNLAYIFTEHYISWVTKYNEITGRKIVSTRIFALSSLSVIIFMYGSTLERCNGCACENINIMHIFLSSRLFIFFMAKDMNLLWFFRLLFTGCCSQYFSMNNSLIQQCVYKNRKFFDEKAFPSPTHH